MTKEIETERRFLLKKLPKDLEMFSYEIIEDLMLKTNEPHPHIRLRRRGNNFLLVKKYPKDSDDSLDYLQMVEETIVLNEIEFNILKKNDYTKQEKRRFKYPFNGWNTEIDVWMGELKGLAKLEIEFKNKDLAQKFKMPDFCLKDITNEEWLSGGMLSGKKYKDIKKRLEGLNYSPITLSDLG